MVEEVNLELAPVAPGQDELTVKEQQFAHQLANGAEYKVAWRRAAMGAYSRHKALTLAKHPEVVGIIKDIREAASKASVLSFEEKRAYLAGIVRTPEGELTEESPYAKIIRKTSRGEESFEVKGQDKLKAIELDSKLMGDFDQAEESGGGVLAEFIARIREV